MADQLLLALTYWREYRTQFHVALSYGVHETTATRIINKAEDALVASGRFDLPKQQAVAVPEQEWVVVLIDSTETPIERLKKQRYFYSGKKKQHTLKTQVVMDHETSTILGVAQGRGPTSDLKLFRESSVHLAAEVWYLADGGYYGLDALYQQTVLPVRKPRGGCLSNQDKHDNCRLAKSRIRVEHVICWLKRFRILKERYRNRRKRFGLRARLIAGLHNFELTSR